MSVNPSLGIMLVITFFFLLLIIISMSVGVLLRRKPIQGSCGGLNQLGLKEGCEICGGDVKKCEDNS